MAYPLRSLLPHRRHARDVHARRLHARRRRDDDRRVRARVQRRRSPSAAASTCARTTLAGGADRATCAPRSPARPGSSPADFRVVGEQSSVPVEGAPARQRPRSAESYPVHGVDDAFLRHTTYGSPHRARGYGSAADVWRALRDAPDLAVVDQLVAPRRDELELRAAAGVPACTASTSRTGRFDAGPRRRPRPADRKRPPLTVIGVLADTHAGVHGRDLDVAARRSSRVRRPACRPTTHLFALAPGVDPNATAKTLESAFLANGDARPTRCRSCSTTRSARRT